MSYNNYPTSPPQGGGFGQNDQQPQTPVQPVRLYVPPHQLQQQQQQQQQSHQQSHASHQQHQGHQVHQQQNHTQNQSKPYVPPTGGTGNRFGAAFDQAPSHHNSRGYNNTNGSSHNPNYYQNNHNSHTNTNRAPRDNYSQTSSGGAFSRNTGAQSYTPSPNTPQQYNQTGYGRAHPVENNYGSAKYDPYGPTAGPSGYSPHQTGSLGGNLHNPDWQSKTLIAFEKNFYTAHDEVSKMTPEQVAEFRRTHDLRVTGQNIPNPVPSFELAAFPDYVLGLLSTAGFQKPTPIQSQGWPMALSGRDMIGISHTGSGKTLAFLLPAIVHLNAQPPVERGHGPICLVLAPTRELAVQTEGECRKFCSSSSLRYTCVYGGESRYHQKRPLREGVDILIATPGRLIDFLDSGETNLERVTYLVLDEADRMLDMGFEKQIRTIISQIRPDRQTLLWSATWPKEIQQLAQDFTTDAIKVQVGDNELKASHTIVQNINVLPRGSNLFTATIDLATTLAAEPDKPQLLIFTNQKLEADEVCRALRTARVRAAALHGDKIQAERTRVLSDFRSKLFNVLVATDVAARGLDIKGIQYVINMGLPSNLEEYVHRVGRTGRAGATGTSYTIVPSDTAADKAAKLISILQQTQQTVPQELTDLAAPYNSRHHSSRNGGGNGYYGRGGNSRGFSGGNSYGGSSRGGSYGGSSRGGYSNGGGGGERRNGYTGSGVGGKRF